jgi:hypothetical protein
MDLFKEREMINRVLDKFRRIEAGEFIEFTAEEAAFAGAFVEDAIGFKDVDHADEEGDQNVE